MFKQFKIWLFTWLVKHLYNLVEEEDILKYDPRKKAFRVQGRILGEDETEMIIKGAAGIRNSLCWEYLLNDAKHEANKQMYLKSTNVDHMLHGKMILYVAEMFDNRLKNISEYET